LKILKQFSNLIFQFYIAFLSAIPTEVGIRIRYIAYKPLFKKTNGKFRIDSGVTIIGFSKIEVGENSRFEKNSYMYAVDSEIILGKDFFLGIESKIFAVRANIIFGDFCMIAPNCILVSDNHKYQDRTIPIMQQGHDAKAIIFEDDIWLGSNCTVLKGVLIEHGSIVAAGSVVTKSISKYTISGGVPARFIKER